MCFILTVLKYHLYTTTYKCSANRPKLKASNILLTYKTSQALKSHLRISIHPTFFKSYGE